MMAFMNKR